jgi:hypothetical protein
MTALLVAVLNGLTALTLGGPVLIAATVTGQKAELCAVMKGTYDPKAADQCVGGDWVRVIPLVREVVPSK